MNIAYIFGLFEDKTHPLFSWLKARTTPSLPIEWNGIELYPESEFGSISFTDEIKRIQDIITDTHPQMIIAHSLGAYLATQVSFDCPSIFLEPSLSVSDIVVPNLKHENGAWLYDDGEYKMQISTAFVESIKRLPSIKESCERLQNAEVCILGAGKGGHKVAEQYHQSTPHSQYIFLPNADHAFSDEENKREILTTIEKRLDTMSSRSGCVRTVSAL